MGKSLLILLLTAFCVAQAKTDSSSSRIEFRNSTIHFTAAKEKNLFKFSDDWGPREIKIQKCNRQLVEKFWGDLLKNVKSLQSPQIPKGRSLASLAWVKYEGVQFRVLDFEPAMRFFNKVTSNSHVLFLESKKRCKGK